MTSLTANPPAIVPPPAGTNIPPTVRIEPPRSWLELHLKEVWDYRGCFIFWYGESLVQWLVLGVIVGLMLDVYYANLMIVSVLVVEATAEYWEIFRSGRSEAKSLMRLFERHLLFSCVVCVVMLPTFLSRWIVYGGPFKTGYLSARKRVSEGTSLGSIHPWVAKRRHDGLTDGLGSLIVPCG